MTNFSEYSLKFSYLKCFGSEPQGFDLIKPINIIIGRNNSGKSTLLDLFSYLVKNDWKHDGSLQRERNRPLEIIVSTKISSDIAKQAFPGNINPVQCSNQDLSKDFAERLVGRKITVQLNSEIIFKNIEKEDELFPRSIADEDKFSYRTHLEKCIKNPFEFHKFYRISPERRLLPEEDSPKDRVNGDGSGATNLIQRFLNKKELPRDLVRIDFLKKLNEIFAPDAHFREIFTQQIDKENEWEIYLDEGNKGIIPLSQSGHGLQTVILVLIHTILIPHRDKASDLSTYIFGFEELENNLHPALFRRLLKYIQELAEKGVTFFLTTHSHTIIDMFSRNENAQIVHVTHDGKESKCTRITTYDGKCGILDDLAVRASDILQANCVIWVEGPSDRKYINRWIELYSQRKIKEGLHYQCLFYGGRLLKHLSGVTPEEQNEAVQIFRINRRACVVIDSDKGKESQDINSTKKQIKEEVDNMGDMTWITDGREIENYISEDVTRHLQNKKLKLGKYEKIYEYEKTQADGTVKKCTYSKVPLAKELVPQINADNWKVYDLEDRIVQLCKLISKWNEEPEYS